MNRVLCCSRMIFVIIIAIFSSIFSTPSYSQTFVGLTSSSVNLMPATGPAVTVFPATIVGMQAGDLVVVYVQYRSGSGTISVVNTGGQSWNSGATTVNGSNHLNAIFWCRYNGTWTAPDPSFSVGAGSGAMTAIMYVYRPNNASSLWGIHVPQANAVVTNTAVSITGYATTMPRTVTMGFWGNSSTNTWGAVAGAGWVKPAFPIFATQLINNGSGNLTHTAAYNIQTATATLANVSQTQSASVSTGTSIMTWYELTNDECTGATTLISNGACTNTTGSLNGATISAGVPAGCVSGTNTYDVWYQVTATSSSHTVQISNLGTAFTRRQIVIYQGNCGILTPIACSALSTSGASLSLTSSDLSPGITYFIRVIFNNTTATPISTNGNFSICVTTGTNKPIPSVTTGKSYTNISRPNGGVIMAGDVLEFRATIGVGSFSQTGSIYNVSYHDTIPSGLSYVANSIRFRTNEGMEFESAITGTTALTDASGDDEAVFSSNVLRVNVGSLTKTSGQSVLQVGAATTPITYASSGGGKINHNGRPSQFGSFCIIVVTYRVTVTAATGSTFTSSNGEFRYKTTANPNDVAAPQTIVSFPRYTAYISLDGTLCLSSVGINTYSLGDFGNGTTRHDSTQLTTAPGYTWSPFNTGSPGDGFFAVVNNTSANRSTNKYVPVPNSARVHNVWDIIGDHTNAANQDSGNFAVDPGTNGGYMAVVNAAYGINNAVQRTITGLCSDTYYEFSAWFKNICPACSSDSAGRQATTANFKPYLATKTLNDSAGVSPDLTYTIDGIDYYTTGQVTYDRRWIKKGFLFKTGPSQTSVTLTIRNNAPGGGGNDWALDDIGLATCLPRLTMRPGRNPVYCNNNQVTLSVAVSTFYNNYVYYFWERSTDNGVTWTEIHGSAASPLSYSYTNFVGGEYRDTVALPSFIATMAMNGYKYRIRTATSISNLSSTTCAIYNSVDVISIIVQSPCTPLPNQVLRFNVQLNYDKSFITWSAKEDDLKGYEIERSADGKVFHSAGFVNARTSGGSETSYSFADPVAVNGKVYYRIKLITKETDELKYTNILSVAFRSTDKLDISNLVNPFYNSTISFQLNAFEKEVILLQLTDALGSQIVTKKITVFKGSNSVLFEVPAFLQKGSYLLRIISSSGNIHRIIQKQ